MRFLPSLVLTFSLLLFSAALRGAEVTVFAAASLSNALEEAAAVYEKQQGGRVRIVSQFAASSTLARQISAGARADLFFSADEAQMDRVKDHLLPGSRRSFLSNTLVIIVPKGEKTQNLSPQELANARRLALAEPELVPAGVYAKAYLTRLGLWEKVAPRVVPTANVRAALAAVETGNADAAMVYRTDALVSKKVTIAHEVAREDGPLISYPVALLKGACSEAADFLKFLTTPDGQRIFERHGFLPIAQP